MAKLLSLRGVSISGEAKEAARGKYPLFLGIPLASGKRRKICQLECVYCFSSRKALHEEPLSLQDHFLIIDQFSAMGGKYVKTAHEGEPFLDNKFYTPEGETPLLDYANSRGLYWTSFSNLLVPVSGLDNLYRKRVTFIGKLNSLRPEVQEQLCGHTGHYLPSKWTSHNGVQIPVSLKRFIDSGFNRVEEEGDKIFTRLGVDIVVTSVNISDIPKVVEFCLENNIYPDIELLELFDDKLLHRKLQITGEQKLRLYQQLLPLLGEDFLERERQMTTDFCPAYSAGIVYNNDGSLRYCYVVPMSTGFNLKTDNLSDIYPTLLRFKEIRRDRILGKIPINLGCLAPCPNGQFK